MGKINIEDGSGDKKYFTIVPNYILNHSTLWDREVYIQMKRIAGEYNTCWTSQKNLARQCGISVSRLKKSLSYLVEHGWITKTGTKEVATPGGHQEINEYKVADLWKLNTDFYEEKGVALKNTPRVKGVSPKTQRGIPKELRGVSLKSYKEEPVLIRTNKEEIFSKENTETKVSARAYGDPAINQCLDYLRQQLGGSLDDTEKNNRRFAYLLLQRFKKDYPDKNSVQLIKKLISYGLADEFHSKNIATFKYLYYHAQKIILAVKSSAQKSKVASTKDYIQHEDN